MSNLQKMEPRSELPAVRSPEALIAMAIENKTDVGTMKELLAMRRELQAEEAKRRFDEAMAAFQEDCPIVTKEKGVPDRSGGIAYKYAPLEAIVGQIRPFLKKHGFHFTLDTDTASALGWVIASCKVTHNNGHSEVSTAKMPLGTKTGIMSDTQVFAGALTFASRRALLNAFGLVTSGEDIDGAGRIAQKGPSSVRPVNTAVKELAKELWDVLASVRGPEKNWRQANNWLLDNGIITMEMPTAPDFAPDDWPYIIESAKKKIGGGK